MGVLLGLVAMVVCLAVGATLAANSHVIIGIAVMLAALPAAIVTWLRWSDTH